MEQLNNDHPFTDEEESGFDIMEWVFNFLHYWYLFVICVIIALGFAYLKNRSWKASYMSSGTIMIEDNRSISGGTQAMMQGFGVESGYKNVTNQIIMLGSNDLISRVVDSLPYLQVDYLTVGNFKTRNIYKTSPIYIKPDFVSPEAYNLLFKIKLYSNGTYEISVDDNKLYSKVKITGRYGQPIQHNLFFINVFNVNDFNRNQELYFQFRDKQSLINDFAGRLGFDYVKEGSSVLNVSLTSEVPDRDIDFINKLCEVFLAENLERKNDVANKTIKFIDDQLGVLQQSLSVSEDEMTRFRQSNQIVDVSSHTSELLGKATKYDAEQSELKLKETYFNYLSNYLKTNMEDGGVVAPSSLGINEPMLLTLVQQLNDLHLQRSEVPEKNVYYAKFTRDINNVKAAIMEVVKNMRASLDIEKNDFNKRMAVVNKQIAELPTKELQMIAIERKYKVDDNYYTFFLQKRAEAEIQKASNSPDNNILDKARTVAVTNNDVRSKTIMMSLILGILIPALFVILKEVLNNTVRSPKDVEKNSSYPLIGVVRHTKSNDPVLAAKNPRSSFTEMFRVIRTRVEFIAKRKSNIMIMVTSAESGDGKTFFCTNMTSVYAMISPKTILVDMDIRKPGVHSQLAMENTIGVTNYLINQNTLDEVITTMPGINYDILPAGTVPPNPGELIRSEKLKDMFEELRRRYDYIVIDTSPIGLVADAYSLAPLSDVNIFVTRSDKSSKPFYKKLSSQLKADKIPNMFTVLNDVLIDGNHYTKYNSYGYGYTYGYGYGYTAKKRREAAEHYSRYYHDDGEL